jgi:hypothetical protein
LKEFISTPTRVMYDGEPLFEEMEPSSREEEERWRQNRLEAYNGSFRQFALALLGDRLEEAGFKTYHRAPDRSGLSGAASPGARFTIDADEIVKDGKAPQERLLDFHGFVEIVFLREVEDESYLAWQGRSSQRPKYRSSMIQLERGPTVIDLKGDVPDPYGVTFYGYLAFERVADELPKEFRP